MWWPGHPRRHTPHRSGVRCAHGTVCEHHRALPAQAGLASKRPWQARRAPRRRFRPATPPDHPHVGRAAASALPPFAVAINADRDTPGPQGAHESTALASPTRSTKVAGRCRGDSPPGSSQGRYPGVGHRATPALQRLHADLGEAPTRPLTRLRRAPIHAGPEPVFAPGIGSRSRRASSDGGHRALGSGL